VTTEDAAREAWAMLTRADDPMPAVIARDWVMEMANVERDEAVKSLAGAGADWLQSKLYPSSDWNFTPYTLVFAIRILGFGKATEQVKCLRWAEVENPPTPATPAWLAWCDLAERAVELLRELTAVEATA
jgi:hypothetical protein